MGNTMIQDSTTGNIMGLRDGFVPVGMKEYGGILYIASFNPQTQEGQLGTIPSPVINYSYITVPYLCDFSNQITNIDEDNNGVSKSTSLLPDALPKYLKSSFQISDKRFQVGDQFIVNLMFETFIKTKRTCQYQSLEAENYINETRYYNLISGFKENPNSKTSDYKDYGWFKVNLSAKVERSNDTINLSNSYNKRQAYYLETQLEPQLSPYWFINEPDAESQKIIDEKTGLYYLPLDTERCQANDSYRTYPNILPGYLYINIEAELPENFQFFLNTSTKIKSPNIFLIVQPEAEDTV